MTYPPQQPLHNDPRYASAPAYAQQYAPPAQQPQQYGAPQGTAWMPPAYGGAPAGTPPQYGGQGIPATPPPLGQSARTGEGGPKAPQPRHLIGRTVIFEPVSIDENATVEVFNQATRQTETVVRPKATYHLTVVDGGPLVYGDNKSQKIDEQHGFTLETQVPARFLNCQSDRWGIVQEIRDAMARQNPATVGVIVQGTKGTKGSPPFLVTKPGTDLEGRDRPDGEQRFQAATQVWNAIFAKTFTSPEPRSLVAPPAAAPPPVQYQPPTQGYSQTAPAGYAQQQYQQTGTVPTPYGAAPAGQLHPEYVAAATQPAYPMPPSAQPGYGQNPMQQYAQQPSMIPGYTGPVTGAGIPQEYHVQPPQPSPFAQAAQQSAPPANPAFDAWLATLPPEQAAAQRAALAGQAGQPQGPGI